jgi:hypothetical protein
MVDTSNSSNPTEEHVGKHLRSTKVVDEFSRTYDALVLARRWAAAWKRAAKRLMSEVGILADELLDEGRCPGGGKPCMFGDGGGIVCKTHFITYTRLLALMRRNSFRRLIADCRDLSESLAVERRAVEALAEHIEIACEGFSHGSMSAITVAPGGYMDAAEIAAWARNRALEEGGEPDGA